MGGGWWTGFDARQGVSYPALPRSAARRSAAQLRQLLWSSPRCRGPRCRTIYLPHMICDFVERGIICQRGS